MSPLLSTNNQELMAHLFSDHCDQFGMIMEKAGRRRRQNVLRAVSVHGHTVNTKLCLYMLTTKVLVYKRNSPTCIYNPALI